nr:glutathione S-transferase sigma 6 [Brachionus rubens]
MSFIFKLSVLVLVIIVGATCSDYKYKLSYFDIRGRGEFIRFIFSAAQEPFEDNRIKESDWPSLKPTTPFGQLPVLEVTDDDGETTVISQSKAIARFLAKQFEFDGEDDLEDALIDMYADQLGDTFDSVAGRNLTKEERDKILDKNIEFFESRLNKNGRGFLVGKSLSWADIYLSQLTDFLGDEKQEYLEDYPNVASLDRHVRGLPGVSEWIARRPPRR